MADLLVKPPKSEVLPSKPTSDQYDALGQFIGTKKTETDSGTLFEGTDEAGKAFQRFVPRPQGLYQSKLPDLSITGQPAPQSQMPSRQPAMTLDTAPAYSLPKAPTFVTELTGREKELNEQALQAQINQLTAASEQQIAAIQEKGRQSIGSSKAFLAKAGALGRTISGAPLETNLGVLGMIQNKVDAAIKEEKQNLENAIIAAKTNNLDKVQKRLDALNALAQTNFDNALKLVQEERNITSEARANKLADIQYEQLSYTLENGKREDVLKTIESMAKNGVSLDELSASQIAEYEKTSGLPAGSLDNYYKAVADYNQIANETNKLALEQARANLAETQFKSLKDLLDDGYKYVKTPAERDKLIAEGRQTIQYGGRTYVAPVEKPTGEGGGGGSYKDAISEMTTALNAVVGDDGFVSPDDYSFLKQQWREAGFSNSDFDSEFKGYRNPANEGYKVGK